MATGETSPRSFREMIKQCCGTAQDRRNQWRFAAWILLWAVTNAAAIRTLKADIEIAAPLTWLLAAVPAAVSVVAVFAYLRYLRMSDELMRKIQLEGLALGFGAGIVVTAGYQVFEAAGAPQSQPDTFLVVMMFGWAAGQLLGMLRYR